MTPPPAPAADSWPSAERRVLAWLAAGAKVWKTCPLGWVALHAPDGRVMEVSPRIWRAVEQQRVKP